MKKTNSENSLEKHAKQKASGLNILQAAISCLLFAVIFLSGLPLNLQAQMTGDDDVLKMNGNVISVQKLSDSRASKMSVRSYSEMKTRAARNNSVARRKTARGESVSYAVLNVEFKTPASRRSVFTDQKQSKLKDAWILTVIDRFADVFISTQAAWDALLENPNVLRVEYSTEVTAPPPPPVVRSKLQSQAVAENIVRGGFKGLTGKNVIVAILDTGIDFRHPDFITYDSKNLPTSRISYLWDTATEYKNKRGSVAPFKFPNGASIGTLYTKEQLTAELRSAGTTIPPTDLDGHGTACASVAAGNGNADKRAKGLNRKEVEGVAPEADIIGVRLGRDGLENSYLLNAIAEWLEKEAGAKPLVISGSFGGHFTGHDGQRIEERQLNARFPLDKAGRAIVFAAGNEGSDPIHAKVNFDKEPKLVSWNAGRPTLIKIYFDSDDPGIKLVGTKASPIEENLQIEQNPITNQFEATLRVNPGAGGVWFENASGKTTEAHLYFFLSDGSFSEPNLSYSYLVGSPGNTENAITVGSYDWNDNFHSGGKVINLSSVCSSSDGERAPFEIGFLSCYSSPGPNRGISGKSATVKPDIVAPGEWFPSANAKVGGQSAGDWASPDSTGFYRAMNGTSAATPYTSGIVALMFQKKPTLKLGEVKNLLRGKVSKTGLNPFAQALPNNNWGYGKLDMAA
ncbi:MAG: S8 family serine peptidase, partial [Acidobacteriota bacterium]